MLKNCIGTICVLFATLPALSQEVRWRPEKPTVDDVVTIEIHDATQPGVLHWGVNAEGRMWEEAIPAYRPRGSRMDGVATRTPLVGPDPDGRSRIRLGPFNDTNQPVGTLDFVIQWADGTWENNNEEDYQVPITSGRLTVEPEEPSFAEPVRIIAHRSEPGGLLRWGVNAKRGQWSQPDPVYWPEGSIPSDDGFAVDSPLSDPDEHGRSFLYLGPFDRPEQVVTSLHMAVHWDDEWDTDFGRDYHAVIGTDPHPDAPRITIHTPRDGDRIPDELTVTLDLEGHTRADLWLDGRPVASLVDEPMEWTAPIEHLVYGPRRLVVHSERNGKINMQQVLFWRIPDVPEAPFDPERGYGATEHEDGTVTFALYAPGKQFVSLIGDFNDWDPNEHMMNRSPDGTWWLTLPLEPGRYRYQYKVNGQQRIADPYARKVHWRTPEGKKGFLAAHAKTVLDIGADPFEWTAVDYERPSLEELVIYEFYIHDLCPGEGFAGVIERLDYIRDLGFNAIEPLPFHPWPGEESWGYNPAFLFAVEELYGTPDDLKRLIDEAHQRGMAVIIDMVLNHTDHNAPLYRLYGPDYDASPYFMDFDGFNWGMPKIDQQSEAVKRYTADVIRFWIEEYRIDGFRYDATRWTGWQGYNDWGASWYAYVARQADPDNIQIAEHLPTDPELFIQTEMDTGWHAHFRWRLREMIRDAQLDSREFEMIMKPGRLGFESAFQRIPYTESHDEERVVRELRNAGHDESNVFRRAETALALTLTAPGIPMIYAGQEFGEYTPLFVGWNPLNWDLLDRPENRRLHRSTRELTRLRTAHPALQGEHIEILVNDARRHVAAFERRSGDDAVVVAVNFGHRPQTVQLDLPVMGYWRNVLDRTTLVHLDQPSIELRLQPGQTVVLATPKASAAGESMGTGTAARIAAAPHACSETSQSYGSPRAESRGLQHHRAAGDAATTPGMTRVHSLGPAGADGKRLNE